MEMLPENIVKGLSEAEVQTRLGQCGYNEVREQPRTVRAILKRLLGPIPGCSKLRWYLKWFWERRLNQCALRQRRTIHSPHSEVTDSRCLTRRIPPEFTTIQQVMAASGAMILAVATGSDGHPHIRGLQSLVEALGDDTAGLVRDTVSSERLDLLLPAVVSALPVWLKAAHQ